MEHQERLPKIRTRLLKWERSFHLESKVENTILMLTLNRVKLREILQNFSLSFLKKMLKRNKLKLLWTWVLIRKVPVHFYQKYQNIRYFPSDYGMHKHTQSRVIFNGHYEIYFKLVKEIWFPCHAQKLFWTARKSANLQEKLVISSICFPYWTHRYRGATKQINLVNIQK